MDRFAKHKCGHCTEPALLCALRKRLDAARGFNLLELAVVVLAALTLMAIAVPVVQSTLNSYRLRSAVVNATWAIQATRYQAIMKGYPFAIAFDPVTGTYQVSSQPPGAAGFSNVGSAVPIYGSSSVTLSPATTLQFKPNGMVQATVGTMSLSVSYAGNTKTLSLSSYGNVSIYP